MRESGYNLVFQHGRLHVAGINHLSGRCLQLFQHLALQSDAIQRHAFWSQWVPSAAFLVTLYQYGIGGVKEQDFTLNCKMIFDIIERL
ncbi:hypothetical protein D3C80_1796120 [compost metagenome]